MKTFVYIAGAIIVIGLIAWGIWFFVFAKKTGHIVPFGSNSSSSAQVNVASKDPGVAKDFLGQMQNPSQMTLGGTVIASPYALQVWGDTNGGGEALLSQTSSTGWTLVSLGGGVWSVLGLMQEGVPLAAAEQLVAGISNGIVPSVVFPANVPAGDMITIGTAAGSVTMNNFYKNIVYVAQDQQDMVIQQSSTYDVVYNFSGSSFTLTVFGVPFETVRQAAEAGFLDLLGIKEQDACKLSVYENISGIASAQYAGKTLPLSFCAPGAFGQ
jgi:hypothetical protein